MLGHAPRLDEEHDTGRHGSGVSAFDVQSSHDSTLVSPASNALNELVGRIDHLARQFYGSNV